MGRETKTITVTASVSRHNSEQDKIDNDMLEYLRREIQDLVDDAHAEGAFYHVDVWGP